jgi:hypothetical protein
VDQRFPPAPSLLGNENMKRALGILFFLAVMMVCELVWSPPAHAG